MKPKIDEQVTVKPLGGSSASYPARVLGFAGKQLQVTLDGSLAPAALVQVSGDNWIVLGEVVGFAAGTPAEVMIDVEHLAVNTAELECSGRAWSG